MTADASFTFRLTRQGRIATLTYAEAGSSLLVELELSGVKECDLVGCDISFDKWTNPPGQPISASHKSEIVNRLAAWAKDQGVRICIGPAMSPDDLFATLLSQGHRVERRPDGTVVVTPAMVK